MLGNGQWRAEIQCRGGGTLAELPIAGLQCQRRLLDMGSAGVTVNAMSLARAKPRARDACCAILDELTPWEHELALWRGDDPEPAWVGPVTEPDYGFDSVSIPARDLFSWFERRVQRHARTFDAVDLGFIWETELIDALTHDPTPAIGSSVAATGTAGTRTVDPATYTRAADALRELARTGVDWTVLGRTVFAGDPDALAEPLGTMVTEFFDNPHRVHRGLQAVTEQWVLGAQGSTASQAVVGHAGGVSPTLGLLQDVVNDPTVLDEASADASAQRRIDLLGAGPEYMTGNLLPTAPIDFASLVPGALARLKWGLLCRVVDGDYRLTAVDVTLNVDAQTGAAQETVTTTFVTPGTE